mmetsp:Transcript_63036/g.150196  ORF Transcript_63036/g.150196 Transcript_63036/m.150196 type:complete len:84 (-) Transcript_63036:26-277(-)
MPTKGINFGWSPSPLRMQGPKTPVRCVLPRGGAPPQGQSHNGMRMIDGTAYTLGCSLMWNQAIGAAAVHDHKKENAGSQAHQT